MRIIMSSAEFKINSDFESLLFGTERLQFVEKTFNGYPTTEVIYPKNQKVITSYPLTSGDIAQMSMWDDDREEILKFSSCPCSEPRLSRDLNGNYWISMGGTGWGRMWSAGLGTLDSGKFPF